MSRLITRHHGAPPQQRPSRSKWATSTRGMGVRQAGTTGVYQGEIQPPPSKMESDQLTP